MQPKISVIVPVYNVEKYLAKCLDSLLSQTMPPAEYEVICVNDGSPDSSPEILADYAAKYSNIRVVTQENGGLSSARNAGMDVATGEYIWFVDSDDYIPRSDALELLYEKASESRLDILFFACEMCFEDEVLAERYSTSRSGRLCGFNEEFLPQQVCSGPEMFARLASSWQFASFVWRRIYRCAFLTENNLRFIEGIKFESVPFQIMSDLLAVRFACWSEVFYCYFRREGSITVNQATRSFDMVYGRLVGFEALDRFMGEHSPRLTSEQNFWYDRNTFYYKEKYLQAYDELSLASQVRFHQQLRREHRPELIRRLHADIRSVRWRRFKQKLRRHVPKRIWHTVKRLLGKGN